jgi:hypothetical protein
MIPDSLAWFNALGDLILTCLAGALCGTLACLFLRLRWSRPILLQDFAISGAVVILAVLPIAYYAYYFRGPADIAPRAFVTAGIIGPVVRHVLRFAWLHRANRNETAGSSTASIIDSDSLVEREPIR